MNLRLRRKWLSAASTVGELFIDDAFECFVLEDRYRPAPEAKVKGATCIPLGRYRVIVSYSERFKRDLPLLLDVPGFTGIRIHTGNTPADTEGCLLPGRVRHGESVQESRLAFDALFAKLMHAKDEVWLTVSLDAAGAICL